jgi:hypothetical protein
MCLDHRRSIQIMPPDQHTLAVLQKGALDERAFLMMNSVGFGDGVGATR